MPTVHIEIWSGKPEELKRNLARAVTDVMVEHVGCEPRAVMVIFDEVPKQNWFTGGQCHTEIFKGTR